jgi:hypothetical protein
VTAERAQQAEALTERLLGEFPGLDARRLSDAIELELDAFSEARVQDFVPIFVERRVRASMRRAR